MKVIRHKNFVKNFEKLDTKMQKKVNDHLLLFEKDPFEKKLKNHVLKGKYSGKKSISVGSDLRIVFQEKDDYVVVILIQIGSHSQLY